MTLYFLVFNKNRASCTERHLPVIILQCGHDWPCPLIKYASKRSNNCVHNFDFHTCIWNGPLSKYNLCS